MINKCPECGTKYQRLGHHWSMGSCDYPDLPDKTMEYVSGLLLGDGNIHVGNCKNAAFRLGMTNKEFLEWFQGEIGILASSLKIQSTAEELVEQNKANDLINVVNPDKYKDYYMLTTRRHPKLNKFRSWYGESGKSFEKVNSLTSDMVKMWFVSDGNCKRGKGNVQPTVRLTVPNFVDQKDSILSLFSNCGFSPSWYNHSRKQDETLRFSVEESKTLCDWMGDPPPGFEYKWV